MHFFTDLTRSFYFWRVNLPVRSQATSVWMGLCDSCTTCRITKTEAHCNQFVSNIQQSTSQVPPPTHKARWRRHRL